MRSEHAGLADNLIKKEEAKMGKLLVTVGSITTAARLEKVLRRKKGVMSTVIHTPSAISGGGCSYSIITDNGNLSYVKEAAAESGINVRGYYMESVFEGEKKYYAIS